jgi:hypothetical protein
VLPKCSSSAGRTDPVIADLDAVLRLAEDLFHSISESIAAVASACQQGVCEVIFLVVTNSGLEALSEVLPQELLGSRCPLVGPREDER